MRQLFLSFLGTGYLKPAPGTWGSLAAVIAALPLINASPLLFLAASGVVTAFAFRAVRAEMAASPVHDPSWIVIDEVVGQWVALLPVALGVWMTGANVLSLWPGLVAAFIFFRLFDIWKPGLVGRLDRQETPDSIISDDIAAGLFAAITVALLAALAHGAMAYVVTSFPAPA
ncbi:MAG: phosphatidylglycerophosphatase A [Pseudomonadota bacterium]